MEPRETWNQGRAVHLRLLASTLDVMLRSGSLTWICTIAHCAGLLVVAVGTCFYVLFLLRKKPCVVVSQSEARSKNSKWMVNVRSVSYMTSISTRYTKATDKRAIMRKRLIEKKKYLFEHNLAGHIKTVPEVCYADAQSKKKYRTVSPFWINRRTWRWPNPRR